MRVTKAMLREAWERQPGLRDYQSPSEFRDKVRFPCCALIALGRRSFPDSQEFRTLLTRLNDVGFSAADGVTPVERKHCFLEMLRAGAFDAWLEEA